MVCFEQLFEEKDEDGLTDQSSIKDLSVRVSKATTMLCRKVLLYNNPDFLKKNGLSREIWLILAKKDKYTWHKTALCQLC